MSTLFALISTYEHHVERHGKESANHILNRFPPKSMRPWGACSDVPSMLHDDCIKRLRQGNAWSDSPDGQSTKSEPRSPNPKNG